MSIVHSTDPILQVTKLSKSYNTSQHLFKANKVVRAVNEVSFHLNKGETYGLVGESGCGKSTLGKMLLRLLEPTTGTIKYNGMQLEKLGTSQMRQVRKDLQMVFQDPFTSLNPRQKVFDILEEVLVIHRVKGAQERRQRITSMMNAIGLDEEFLYRYPFELSGGQRQRIGLARALILNPKIVICDEPVSALDVIIQSQIINLMKDLQKQFNVTYLFISHDIGVIRYISDRIGIMYLGELVEEGYTDDVLLNSQHPYTKLLLSAVPNPNPEVKHEKLNYIGEPQSPFESITGCAFHKRCPYVTDYCRNVKPDMRNISHDHKVACHYAQINER